MQPDRLEGRRPRRHRRPPAEHEWKKLAPSATPRAAPRLSRHPAPDGGHRPARVRKLVRRASGGWPATVPHGQPPRGRCRHGHPLTPRTSTRPTGTHCRTCLWAGTADAATRGAAANATPTPHPGGHGARSAWRVSGSAKAGAGAPAGDSIRGGWPQASGRSTCFCAPSMTRSPRTRGGR